MKYTIATGNPVEGFKLMGVFQTREEALQYGRSADMPSDWTIMEILTTYGNARG